MRSLRRRGTAALVGAAAVAGVLTGCGISTPSAPAAPNPPAVPAGLERFYTQQLSWGPCGSFATSEADRETFADPASDCARLEVPLDYAAPDGRTAQIAILRKRTSEPKIGSLVMNPGGPGKSGTRMAAETTGGGPFDLVGFDPRGVGASTPTIDCPTDAELDAARSDDGSDPSTEGELDPSAVAEQVEAKNRQFAERCAQRSGGADVLANVGTRDVARDLDVLRAALGDAQLTYLGFSYGTRIGSMYAEMFPGNVRALVLDGVMDPRQSNTDRLVDQAAGFQAAFDAYATDCARKSDCPLGTDPGQATAVFQSLTRPLIDAPAPVPGTERELSYWDAINGTDYALYRPETWPELSKGLAELRTGDGTHLLQLADYDVGRAANGVHDNSAEAFVVIQCVDEQRITDRTAAAELARRRNEAKRYADDGRGVVGALGPCAFWPVPPTREPRLPQVAGLPPTLVISTTGDPATPYQAGVEMAKALHGRLLTVEGTQHTAAFGDSACVNEIVFEYLVDLRLPADGTRCTLPG